MWGKVAPGKGDRQVGALFLGKDQGFNKHAGLIIASVTAITMSCPRVLSQSLRLSMQSTINLKLA